MATSAETIPHDTLQQTQSPDSGILASPPGQEDTPMPTPISVVDQTTEDGYNWRKYGQKQVKGNEYVRSYYKCTHLKCLVKKRVEKRTRDGHIIDTLYFGMHDHPKYQSSPPISVGFVLPIKEENPNMPLVALAEDNSCDRPVDVPLSAMVAISDNDMESTPQSLKRVGDGVIEDADSNVKRQKKDVSRADSTPREKPTGEPRIVVQTLSEVDIVHDGYRWRKYGQKFVKGNPNPRSYYRCSRSGCPVKKHVERAAHDSKVVLTTYEGQHDHDMPAARIVTHNPAGSCVDAVCHEIVVHSCSIPEKNPTEILSIEAKKNADNTTTCDDAEKKSSEQPNGKLSIKSEESGIVGHTISVPESDSNKQSEKVNSEIEVKVSSCPYPDNLKTEAIQS